MFDFCSSSASSISQRTVQSLIGCSACLLWESWLWSKIAFIHQIVSVESRCTVSLPSIETSSTPLKIMAAFQQSKQGELSPRGEFLWPCRVFFHELEPYDRVRPQHFRICKIRDTLMVDYKLSCNLYACNTTNCQPTHFSVISSLLSWVNCLLSECPHNAQNANLQICIQTAIHW